VSNGVESLFSIGYRKSLFSQLRAKIPCVSVAQKEIQIINEQYWLYFVVDPEMNKILYSRLFPTYMIPIVREFLTELLEKHDVADAMFLVDDVDDLIGGLQRENFSYCVQQDDFRNSVERVFCEVDRRTIDFSNYFSYVVPSTAETSYKPTPSGGIMLNLTQE
jgi:putative transposase